MNISVVETNHGQKSIIWDGYRKRLDRTLKTGDISWFCAKSKPPCKARIRTDTECLTVISQKNEHSHPQDEQKTERYRAKREGSRKHMCEAVENHRLLVKKRYSLMINMATAIG